MRILTDNDITTYSRSDRSYSGGGVPNPPGPVGIAECKIPTDILEKVLNLRDPTEEEYDVVLPITGAGYAMKIESRTRPIAYPPEGKGEHYISFNGYRPLLPSRQMGYAENFSVMKSVGDEITAVDGESLYNLRLEQAIRIIKGSMAHELIHKNVTFFRLRKVQFIHVNRATLVSASANVIDSEPEQEPIQGHEFDSEEDNQPTVLQSQLEPREAHVTSQPERICHHEQIHSKSNAPIPDSDHDESSPGPDPVHSCSTEVQIADNAEEFSPKEPSNFDLNTDDEEDAEEKKQGQATSREGKGSLNLAKASGVPVMNEVAPEESVLNASESESFAKQSIDEILLRRCKVQYGWSDDFARRAIEAYRQFLAVIGSVEDFDLQTVKPSIYVNQVWLQHVADPSGYEIDCRQILGMTLYRNPDIVPLAGKANFTTKMMLCSRYKTRNVDHEIWNFTEEKPIGVARATQEALPAERGVLPDGHRKRELSENVMSFHNKKKRQDLPDTVARASRVHEKSGSFANYEKPQTRKASEVDLDVGKEKAPAGASLRGAPPATHLQVNHNEIQHGAKSTPNTSGQRVVRDQASSSVAAAAPLSRNTSVVNVNNAGSITPEQASVAAKATTNIQKTLENRQVEENMPSRTCADDNVIKGDDNETVRNANLVAERLERDDKPQAGRETNANAVAEGETSKEGADSKPLNDDVEDEDKLLISFILKGREEDYVKVKVESQHKMKKAFKKYASHAKLDLNELTFVLERTGETLNGKKTFGDAKIVKNDIIICSA